MSDKSMIKRYVNEKQKIFASWVDFIKSGLFE
jgi:hypothetical protein